MARWYWSLRPRRAVRRWGMGAIAALLFGLIVAEAVWLLSRGA